MPPPATFAALGLFVQRGFLAPDERRALIADLQAAEGTLAGLASDAPEGAANPEVRRAWEIDIEGPRVADITARLEALRPVLERHFDVRLEMPDQPSFLRYPPGAFYRQHRDRARVPSSSGVDRRAVSLVVFVNDARDAHGFTGGQLRFFELFDEEALADVGLDAEPEAGTLIAFRSDLLHEVSPVQTGVRYSIVTWFLEPAVDDRSSRV